MALLLCLGVNFTVHAIEVLKGASNLPTILLQIVAAKNALNGVKREVANWRAAQKDLTISDHKKAKQILALATEVVKLERSALTALKALAQTAVDLDIDQAKVSTPITLNFLPVLKDGLEMGNTMTEIIAELQSNIPAEPQPAATTSGQTSAGEDDPFA